MTGSYADTARHAVRLLSRSLGYRGDRPELAAARGAVGVLLAVAALTAGLARWLSGSSDLGVRLLLPTFALVCLFAATGPVVLLADNARGGSSSLQKVLRNLPLTGWQVVAHSWTPVALLSGVCTLVLVPPAVVMLVHGGTGWADALTATGSVIIAAYAVALVLLAASKAMLRAPSWASAHYPITLLAYLAVTAIVITGALRHRDEQSILHRAVLAPLLINDIQVNARISLEGWLVSALAALAGAVALAVIVRADVHREVSPAWPAWRVSERPSLTVGEVLHVLRSGAVLSNLIAGLMLCSALMLVLGWVDPQIGTVLAGPVSVLSVTTAGLAPRMVRGTFSVAWPAPLHGGTTWRPWFGRLTVTAGVLFAIGLTPMAVLVIAGRVAGHPSMLAVNPEALSGCLLACLGSMVGLMWLMPASVDDPPLQILGAVAYLTVSGAGTWLVTQSAERATGVGLAVGGLLLGLWLVLGAIRERTRWQLVSSATPRASAKDDLRRCADPVHPVSLKTPPERQHR